MLSKSDFMKFLQCEKYVWLYKHRKDLLEEVTEQQQAIFNLGFTVEEYAQKLFPGANMQMEVRGAWKGAPNVGTPSQGVSPARAPWKGAPNAGAPSQGVSKAGTSNARASSSNNANHLYARADIVTYNPKTKTYDIYEVKAATDIKPEYLPDVAFQKITFEAAGYKVGKTFLVHVNNEYVRSGEIEPEKFLTVEDITDDVNATVPEVMQLIPEALADIARQKEPQVRIVRQCTTPYACPFIPYCWSQAKIPENSVYALTRIREKTLIELLDRGVMDIKDIPDDIALQPSQVAAVKVARTGKAIIKKAKIKEALSELTYPLYFLDYETVMPAVPMWDGTKPYQQVCFQYSLHVMREASKGKSSKAKLEHYEYLASGRDNPMPALLAQLREVIADDGGSVIVWNKSFEMARNREMGEMFPEYADFLESVNGRVYDLMEIFKKRLYVHPEFHGSCSIKKVLPALVPELSYEDLEDIREGTMAGIRWLEVEHGSGGATGAEVDEVARERVRERVRRNLLKYCERDTEAMVRVMGEVGD